MELSFAWMSDFLKVQTDSESHVLFPVFEKSFISPGSLSWVTYIGQIGARLSSQSPRRSCFKCHTKRCRHTISIFCISSFFFKSLFLNLNLFWLTEIHEINLQFFFVVVIACFFSFFFWFLLLQFMHLRNLFFRRTHFIELFTKLGEKF